MDEHFRPSLGATCHLMGPLALWYNDFWGADCRRLPYEQYLKDFRHICSS
jgi:hypothetical protein